MDQEKEQPYKQKPSTLTNQMEKNIKLIKSIFENDQTLLVRHIENRFSPSIQCAIIYTDGMVNNKLLNEDVIKPLLECRIRGTEQEAIDVIAKQIITCDSAEKTSDMDKILQGIVYGDSVLLLEGCDQALILNTKGWTSRAINEPESERVIRGPREGFNEALMTNLSLLRRRIRTPDLKMEFQVFGTTTQTKACLCYVDGIVNKDVLAELKKRLKSISIDGVLDTNYISELIKDAPYSPVKTIGSTEKPDIVAARLLEGRVALLLDGSPVALTLPYLFIENFQSDEDYYINFYFSSLNRIIRLIAFFLGTSLPGIYVALVTFHQEILPTPLLMSISMARQSVPLPTALEAALMLLVFEMLRESGSRMPGSMGQALSIVGALVIGQASVEAKLVSAPMVIIVGLTGISGLMTPRIKGADILLRFSFLICCSILGLYGYVFGVFAFLIHLYSTNSFGVPIMNSATENSQQDKKDIAIRSPWWVMRKRPKFLSPNRVRSNSRRNGS